MRCARAAVIKLMEQDGYPRFKLTATYAQCSNSRRIRCPLPRFDAEKSVSCANLGDVVLCSCRRYGQLMDQLASWSGPSRKTVRSGVATRRPSQRSALLLSCLSATRSIHPCQRFLPVSCVPGVAAVVRSKSRRLLAAGACPSRFPCVVVAAVAPAR